MTFPYNIAKNLNNCQLSALAQHNLKGDFTAF